MFAPVLQQQAVKIVPQIDVTVSKIQDALSDSIPVASLADDVPLMQKALECYQSDIERLKLPDINIFKNYWVILLEQNRTRQSLHRQLIK